ncbi:uncharacterized protein LOC105703113 isoform X2 [Orussus abietinus]|uniref:uncharacterized protein LOC105703113 isoform X2 n=1 Tax=Orussus abietinus TaxID=222816 RepID=UPI000625A7C5|nr:uncharacterized protein LOC105703113 isoform X2 [Orussus abietinus]
MTNRAFVLGRATAALRRPLNSTWKITLLELLHRVLCRLSGQCRCGPPTDIYLNVVPQFRLPRSVRNVSHGKSYFYYLLKSRGIKMWLIGSFATLCLVEFTLAIYVPSERTTKPPVRRESILPWYLTGEDSPPPEDPSRSPKWDLPEDRPREPAIVDAGVKTWPKRLESSYSQRSEPPFQDDFSQRKDLEQKTDHGGSWIPEEVPEENLCDPSNPTENCNVHKSRRRDKVLNVEIIPDLYENVPLDSTKPRKGKILTISKPDHKSIVAKYSSSGVQCPDESATGQFVYPPDCKFFVNCWAGRAFVQPCAPGTLFNPDTLECDFPYKVKCYGGELADFTAPDNLDATGRREPLVQGTHSKPGSANLLEPKCPPHVTGLLAHPADCTKFLQCANGGTFVMDCGPGTVFNPAISVCDWPNNVQGCEDALKTDEEVSLLTGHQDYGSKKDTGWSSGQNRIQKSEEKISCPAGHTGQLPHPRDCKKFLQCNRGGTFIMDCGPGTVFNPITTACDWPYKVKGCNGQQNKPISQGGNAGSQWPTTQNTGHRVQQSWQGNVQSQHNGPNWGQQNGQHVYAQYNPADPDPRGHGYQLNGGTNNQPWYYNQTGPDSNSRHYYGPYNGENQHSGQWPREQGPNSYDYQTSKPGQYHPSIHRPYYQTNRTFTKGSSSHANGTNFPHSYHGGQWGKPWNPHDNRKPADNATDQQTHPSFYGQNIGTWRWDPRKYNNTRPGNDGNSQNPNPWYPANVPSRPNVGVDRDGRSKTDPGYHQYPYVGADGNIYQSGTYEPGQIPSSSQRGHGRPGWTNGHSQGPQGEQQRPPWSQVELHPGQPGVFVPSTWTGQGRPDLNLQPCIPGQNIPCLDNKQPYTPDQGRPGPNGQRPYSPGQGGFGPELQQPFPTRPSGTGPHNWQPYPSGQGSQRPYPEGQGSPSAPPVKGGRRPPPTLPSQNAHHPGQPGRYPVESGVRSPAPNQSYPEYQPNPSVGGGYQGPKPTPMNQSVWNQVEPSFSVYYVPPVQPLTHPKKPGTVTPLSGQFIRLRGGSGPRNGYVEVQGAQPGWGVVCDSRNSWSLKEAHVVCKQLGYYRGAEMSWQGRNGQWGVPSWIAADTVNCLGNETYFQSCRFTHGHECQVQRDAIGVQCLPNRIALCRKDEIPHGGQCYHLADKNSGLNHAEALNYCAQRKSQLLDVTSQEENNFISELLVQSYPEVESIMTSGVGFTTFNRIFWLWEDSSRAKFRFIKWWPGWMEDKVIPPHVGVRPVCVVMKKKFPCHDRPDSDCDTDYFFWDVEDCASSTKGHSYVCERPYDDIGCVYGKGNQYSGKANISSSGKECLYWDDDRIAHSFLMNVISRETKEKLKGHNFCRNPNPNRESKPWCFVGPHTERESCDLPSCGKLATKKSLASGSCKPKHFECLPGECIPSPWVCDGEEDCTNGADEKACVSHMSLFKKIGKHKLEGYDVEKWLNTPLKTCALRCKEADFTCRSFVHNAKRNVCLLSDSNVGLTGALIPDSEYDYFEMISRTLNCDDMFTCDNKKCINRTMVCDGKNDCNDRSDENICSVDELDYAVRLAGSNNTNEGRVEVKILGHWGQVCDDGFGMINADVICKELGFNLGALSVRLGGFYGNLDPPSRFLVDQLKCRGNETSLRECDFDGWGVHNCQPEEAVGIVCKTAVNSCQEGHWKCDDSPTCIPTPFICDEVKDCPDGSDESPAHCDAPFQLRLANGSSPMEGRVEVRHHGVWGTVCDDDFSNATATVICRSLGYGGVAIAKKNGVFGPGEGPIWLDEVFCYGNETQLYRCEHNHWGLHNCDHEEDAGVICSPGDITVSKLFGEGVPEVKEVDINDLLPSDCGKREEDFSEDDEMLARVVRGSIAPRGAYPWQASIRIRGHSRSSHWCGAVVLSPLHVLTAAHCLEGYNKGTYFVRAGDHNTEVDEGTEVEANIEDYYIHEEFRKGQRMNNDIALVLLKGRGIPLGRNVMPICLPSENAEYPDGLNCTISGWGSVETGKSAQSRDLRYGWVPLLDRSICRASYVYGEGAISDGMVCAGYLDEGVDTCDGDSGGPLACPHNGAFTLFGVTSWGQHCGSANKPGVYVKVAYYRRWIDQKIKESLSGR